MKSENILRAARNSLLCFFMALGAGFLVACGGSSDPVAPPPAPPAPPAPAAPSELTLSVHFDQRKRDFDQRKRDFDHLGRGAERDELQALSGDG